LVLSGVCTVAFDFQVVRIVVVFVFVLVMNDFVVRELATELVLHQNSVEGVQALRVSFRMERQGPRVTVSAAFAGRRDAKQGLGHEKFRTFE
jgi:hypothetical protein